MTKDLIIIALLLILIYLYYQNRKLKQLPTTSNQTIFELTEENENKANLIADKDEAIRKKNETEQEVLSLNNRLKNKQQEVTRKESEIERLKKEKSNNEISLNAKLKELKEKYSKQAKLLDEEQTDNNQLTKKITALETQLLSLARQKLKGKKETQELVKQLQTNLKTEKEQLQTQVKQQEQLSQDQLRQINCLFEPQAKDYPKIDFNGLYKLLKTIAEKPPKTVTKTEEVIEDITETTEAVEEAMPEVAVDTTEEEVKKKED